ncbi:MAG: polymer-forming cytoskeletal protein [Alphaproteobacteria bacterium]|nr:polymer-forming cytoskeletal protein [Alphaproteobacteria bacterium]
MFHGHKAQPVSRAENNAEQKKVAPAQPQNAKHDPGSARSVVKRNAGPDIPAHLNANQNNSVWPVKTQPVQSAQGQDTRSTHQLSQIQQNGGHMNNPANQQKDKDNAQSRVDIPGNNFQGRPSYPGAQYPGASAPVSAPSAPEQTPESRSNDVTGRTLVISQGISMAGEIESCEHLVVEGKVEAALKGASQVDITETGEFYGTIEIDEANIAGRFEGDITVRGRLTIQSTGVVVGSITYKELAIEAGAIMDGSVSPIGSQNAAAKSGKRSAPKAKKISQGAELPFADKGRSAAA